MRLHALALVAAMLALATPIEAAEIQRLSVGKTNIFCVKAPCPWRGIAPADADRHGPADLLWSRQQLPPLIARADDADAIRTAWDADGCLLVDGALIDSQLRIDAIVGECP